MSIVSISGLAGSGKDLTASIIEFLTMPEKELVFHRSNNTDVGIMEMIHDGYIKSYSPWERKAWSTKLKEVATLLTGVPIEKWEDQEFKKTYMGKEWNKWGIFKIKDDGDIAFIDYFNNKKDAETIYGKDGGFYGLSYVNITYRQFLQWLGTEAMRNGLHENVWVNGLMSDYKGRLDKEKFSEYAETSGLYEELREQHLPNRVNKLSALKKYCGHERNYVGKLNYPSNEFFEFPKWIITGTRFKNELQAVKDKGGICIKVNRPSIEPINLHSSETEWQDWEFDYVIDNSSTISHLIAEVKKMVKKFDL